MVLKIEKDHQLFRQIVKGRILAVVLASFCAIGLESRALATPEDDVSAAKKVYDEFKFAITSGNRDQAIKLVYIPREYLRPLANGWLDACLESDRLLKNVEKKIGTLKFEEREGMGMGPTKFGDMELAFHAMDTSDAHKPVIARLKIKDSSPDVEPVASIMPTDEGYKVNILSLLDPDHPIPQQTNDLMKEIIEPQLKALPEAVARLRELRARVESGELNTMEKLNRAGYEISQRPYPPATMPANTPSN